MRGMEIVLVTTEVKPTILSCEPWSPLEPHAHEKILRVWRVQSVRSECTVYTSPSMQGNAYTNYRSCHSSDDHQADFWVVARRFGPTYPSPSSPLLLHSLAFLDWSLSESSILREPRIWTPHLFSHCQNFVYHLRVICPFLHRSWLCSLTIDAKSIVVFFMSLTLISQPYLRNQGTWASPNIDNVLVSIR